MEEMGLGEGGGIFNPLGVVFWGNYDVIMSSLGGGFLAAPDVEPAPWWIERSLRGADGCTCSLAREAFWSLDGGRGGGTSFLVKICLPAALILSSWEDRT